MIMKDCFFRPFEKVVDNENLTTLGKIIITLKEPLTNPTQDDLYIHLRTVGSIHLSSKYGATRIKANGDEVPGWTEETLVEGGYMAVRLNNTAGNNFVIESAYQLKGIYFGTGFENCIITGLDNAGEYGEFLGIQTYSPFQNMFDISDYKGMYCVSEFGPDQYTPCFTIDDIESFAKNNPTMKFLSTRSITFPLEYVKDMGVLQCITRCSGNIENIHSSDLRQINFGWAEHLTGTIEGMVANCVTAGKTSGIIKIINDPNQNCEITFDGEVIPSGAMYVHWNNDVIIINNDDTGWVGPQIPKNNWV